MAASLEKAARIEMQKTFLIRRKAPGVPTSTYQSLQRMCTEIASIVQWSKALQGRPAASLTFGGVRYI